MKYFSILISLFLVLGMISTAIGQISSGGTPPSFSEDLSSTIETITMPEVDVEALLMEDEINEQTKDLPFRFGYPFPVDLGLSTAGTWETLDDGSRVWRLKISCPEAYSINLVYSQYWLPEGAEFFIYTEDRNIVRGAYTQRNNKSHGEFATSPIPGNISILEYYEPAGIDQPGEIQIKTIVHGYRNVFGYEEAGDLRGFGDSGWCNINVNCPEGDPWVDEIRSVAMITTQGGSRICTGALVNNVLNDYTPYFLTANHCLGGENTWVFVFNYESPSCENIDGPLDQSVSGSTRLANHSASDFALLELSEVPPQEYEVFYAGWSAVDEPSQHSVGISHPRGDIKKICFDEDPVTSWAWPGTPADSHWRIAVWDDGTTEPASSGSPLFDPEHRVVGQLHGGRASCDVLDYDAYGKFSMSWDYGSSPSNRLKDWLDPEDSGTLIIDGLDAALTATVVGVVTNAETGDPLPAHVWVEGERDYETIANENGDYLLEIYPGTYTLYAEFFGYYLFESESFTIENEEQIILDIALEAQPTGSLEGVVTDIQTGMALEEAVINLADVPIPDATTDANGFYRFDQIPADYTYEVHCNAVSYGEQTASVYIPADETITQNFALQMAQSFEFGDGEWNGTHEWEWGVPQASGGPASAYEGQYCWGTNLNGDYNPLTRSHLYTPAFELNASPPYQLDFYHWYETVDGWDGGHVSISTDNGENWSLIHPVGDYPDPSIVGLAGQPGYTGSSEGWIHAVFDLTEYANQTVQFQFKFGSTNSSDYGWFIDFVTVLGQGTSGGELLLSGQTKYRANDLPLANVEMSLSGDSSYTTTTDLDGYYTFLVNNPGNYVLTPDKLDEVNGISTFDAAWVAQYTAEMIDLSEEAVLAADVTGNGEVSAMDAARIAQYAAGMEHQSLCGQWGFIPAERVYEPLSGDMNDQDFIGILYGEVTDNWQPEEIPPALKREANHMVMEALTPVNMITSSHQTQLRTDASEVLAFQFVIESETPLTTELAANMPADWQLIVNQMAENTWFVGGYGITPVSNTELVTITCDNEMSILSGLINENPIQVEKMMIAPLSPSNFSLSQNYPNPFNPITTIQYQVPYQTELQISVYTTTGQLVKTLFSGEQAAGSYSLQWNGVDDAGQVVSSGIYFYRLETETTTQIRKMILLK